MKIYYCLPCDKNLLTNKCDVCDNEDIVKLIDLRGKKLKVDHKNHTDRVSAKNRHRK